MSLQEKASALICHFPLDKIDSGSTIYDISGNGNNGTVSSMAPTITTGAPRRYSSSMFFNGVDNFIVCGRGAMVNNEITVNVWAYMYNWNTNCVIVSCTEGGGWEFSLENGSMIFYMGTGTSSNTYKNATAAQTLTSLSGWVMLTGTYDGFSTKIYINGALSATNAAYTTKTSIYYHPSNGLFIGAEAGSNTTTPTGEYFHGKLSDFRVYSTVLTAAEIYELYDATSSTVFTDQTSFNNTSNLFIKEVHLNELQTALTTLNNYLPNVNNCGYINCCESCQNLCICQSDKCQACQNACTNCTNGNQGCQNTCSNCTSGNQSCQSCQRFACSDWG